MLEELVEIIKAANKKVIGIEDLERKASLSRNALTDYLIEDLCRLLRQEGIIAYPQGRGVFKHLRIKQ
jgi:hypothetical protein